MKPFDASLPWVGVGMPDVKEDVCKTGSEGKFDLNLGYKVELVRFDAAEARIVVKAVDCSDEIMFAI